MQLKIPEQYMISKFFQYAGFPVYKAGIHAYNGCCPACREGRNWGKKKRLFYFPKKEQLFCHNCGKGWTPIGWLRQVCRLSLREIKKEIGTDYNKKPILDINAVVGTSIRKNKEKLPADCINLFDKTQVQFYKKKPIVRKCLALIKRRRLLTAINRPKALYVSLTDFLHKNRLCIPFYGRNHKIMYYQTRKILDDDTAKYLCKLHDDKSVCGLEHIDTDFPYIFLLEGPIDAMFIKNGIAVAGTSLTTKQKKQLADYPTHELIWCLDNQHMDPTSAEKTERLIAQGYKVFKWPKSIKYKDFNDYCVANKVDEFDYQVVLKNLSNNTLASKLSNIKF